MRWALLYLLCVAREKDFDVVLIDTAGRMQDNEVSVCYIDLYGVANDFVLFVYGIVAPHASACKGKEIELFTFRVSCLTKFHDPACRCE